MTRIFTIGYAGKNARQFFTILKQTSVRKIIDVPLYNTSQLAGFTKRHDIEYFLQTMTSCFLCNEAKANNCRRRLVAEYLAKHWQNVSIHHL